MSSNDDNIIRHVSLEEERQRQRDNDGATRGPAQAAVLVPTPLAQAIMIFLSERPHRYVDVCDLITGLLSCKPPPHPPTTKET